jgi:alcohol dehydrogenase class IV
LEEDFVPFTYHLPTKIVFGQPAPAALAAELISLKTQRVLLVSDPGLVQVGLVGQVEAGLVEAGYTVTLFTKVSSNPTTAEVAAGLALAQAQGSQAIVALGGGSALDVGKGIALLLTNGGTYVDYQWGGKPITERSLPLLAVPTTAGTGSEVSRVAVIVDPERPFKKGVLSPLMFPYAAIIDPALTRWLPPQLTAATGMDAFIHALEAYVGKRAHPYTDRLALAALETAWSALPQAVANGSDMAAREAMLLAALWGGTAMDHAGLGLIHALSGPLTSYLKLHHGLANALILLYALRFNLPAIAPARLQQLNQAFGLPLESAGETLVATLAQFIRGLGLPTHLHELNIRPDQADWSAIAEETTRMAMFSNNPRPATVADCEAILAQMY